MFLSFKVSSERFFHKDFKTCGFKNFKIESEVVNISVGHSVHFTIIGDQSSAEIKPLAEGKGDNIENALWNLCSFNWNVNFEMDTVC